MQFSEVLKSRQSVRSYKNKPISGEIANKIIEAIRTAPSAGNLQAYKVYVIESPDVLNKLAKAAWGQDFVSQSNLAFVFTALKEESYLRYGSRGSELYALQDATIAASYCQLAATDLGLASVWVGAFNDNDVSRAIELKDEETPVAIIPVGYADETPYQTPRKPIDQVVCRIK